MGNRKREPWPVGPNDRQPKPYPTAPSIAATLSTSALSVPMSSRRTVHLARKRQWKGGKRRGPGQGERLSAVGGNIYRATVSPFALSPKQKRPVGQVEPAAEPRGQKGQRPIEKPPSLPAFFTDRSRAETGRERWRAPSMGLSSSCQALRVRRAGLATRDYTQPPSIAYDT